MTGFRETYFGAIIKPVRAFERLLAGENYFAPGFLFIIIPIVAYTLMYIFLVFNR